MKKNDIQIKDQSVVRMICQSIKYNQRHQFFFFWGVRGYCPHCPFHYSNNALAEIYMKTHIGVGENGDGVNITMMKKIIEFRK